MSKPWTISFFFILIHDAELSDKIGISYSFTDERFFFMKAKSSQVYLDKPEHVQICFFLFSVGVLSSPFCFFLLHKKNQASMPDLESQYKLNE